MTNTVLFEINGRKLNPFIILEASRVNGHWISGASFLRKSKHPLFIHYHRKWYESLPWYKKMFVKKTDEQFVPHIWIPPYVGMIDNEGRFLSSYKCKSNDHAKTEKDKLSIRFEETLSQFKNDRLIDSRK